MPFSIGDRVRVVIPNNSWNGTEGTVKDIVRDIATIRSEHAGLLSFYTKDLVLSRNASARTIGEFFKKQEQMTCPST